METRYFGERVTRNEDPRLLTGRALFIDDVNLPGMLEIAFLRSPHAHARINRIDASRAKARDCRVPAAPCGPRWPRRFSPR